MVGRCRDRYRDMASYGSLEYPSKDRWLLAIGYSFIFGKKYPTGRWRVMPIVQGCLGGYSNAVMKSSIVDERV